MRKLLLVLSLTALSSPCLAQVYGEFGKAFDHPYAQRYSDVKHLELGYIDYNSFFAWQAGVGGWTDISGHETLNSQYITVQGGVRVQGDSIHVAYLIGPAIQSHPDVLLGSIFELEHSVMIMYVDKQHRGVGVVVHHWSDGGINSNNYGRNSICLRVEF